MHPRFLLLALVPLLLAADWPRFRGPNGSGVADDNSIPVAVGNGDVIWKIDVPGNGVSSPIVSKGKLFLQTATPERQERMLICYHAASGKRLWHAAFTGISRARVSSPYVGAESKVWNDSHAMPCGSSVQYLSLFA